MVRNLSQAISLLETSILKARSGLERHLTTPAHAFARLNTYLEVVDKQRSLLADILKHLQSGNLEALQTCQHRHAALAALVKEDAIELAIEISDSAKKLRRHNIH